MSKSTQARRHPRSNQESRHSTPSGAFRVIFRRIKRLDDKIDLCAQNGLPFLMYQQERDGLFWFVEKVIEQARKLVLLGDSSQKVTAIVNRRELDEYNDSQMFPSPSLNHESEDVTGISSIFPARALDNKDRKL